MNKYAIHWVDGNGNTIKIDLADYGTLPEYSGSTPTKNSTEQYHYVFTSWSPAIVEVTT